MNARSLAALFLVPILGLAAASHGQFWEEDEGWFGDEAGYVGGEWQADDGFGEYGYGDYGYGQEYGFDDYGYYSTDYNYGTDAGWYNDWYGESDQEWSDWGFDLF